jgi:hypothetical protein
MQFSNSAPSGRERFEWSSDTKSVFILHIVSYVSFLIFPPISLLLCCFRFVLALCWSRLCQVRKTLTSVTLSYTSSGMHQVILGNQRQNLSHIPKTKEQRLQLMTDVIGPPDKLPDNIDDIIAQLESTLLCFVCF